MARTKSKSQAILDSLALSNSCNIGRVATEILVEILHFCAAKTAREFDQDSEESAFNADILAVSQVSRHWRAISMETPSLWSKIYITFQTFASHETIYSFEKRISLYFQRSRNLPLDISLAFSDWESDTEADDDAIDIPTISLLSQQAHRWRSATFQFCPSNALENLYSIFPKTLPLLEELDIRYIPGDVGGAIFFSFRGPLLRKLVLERLYAFVTDSPCLDEISLVGVDPDTVMGFLEDASAQCRAEISTMFTPYMAYRRSRTTSSLRSLSFTAPDDLLGDDHPVDLVLDQLTLPNVEDLELIDERSKVTQFPTTELLSLLGRSNSCLTRLYIGRYSVSDEELLSILGQLHALTDLIVKEAYTSDVSCPLSEHFFRRLIGDSHSPPVVPSLLRTEFEIRAQTPDTYDVCLSFIESRRPALRGLDPSIVQNPMSTATLQQASIFLLTGSKVSKTSMEKLEKLRADGLVIQTRADR